MSLHSAVSSTADRSRPPCWTPTTRSFSHQPPAASRPPVRGVFTVAGLLPTRRGIEALHSGYWFHHGRAPAGDRGRWPLRPDRPPFDPAERGRRRSRRRADRLHVDRVSRPRRECLLLPRNGRSRAPYPPERRYHQPVSCREWATPDSRALEQVAAPARALDPIAVDLHLGASATVTMALRQGPPRAREKSSLQHQTLGGSLN